MLANPGLFKRSRLQWLLNTATLKLPLTNSDTIDSRITATRASTKTYFDSTGTMRTAAINEFPREYDPSTLVCLGRSFWEARTNLLLNSLIDGTNLSTQSITTTAAARTLSFYGTGTVTLSGTHSATVVGTGAFPTRTTYTYTPTAGTLTLTVSGTVQYANDELGATASPFIPTAGASVTRAADVASMTGTNFSSWYNQTEGTFLVSSPQTNSTNTIVQQFLDISEGVGNERMFLRRSSAGIPGFAGVDGGVTQWDVSDLTVVSGSASFAACFGYKVNDVALSVNGRPLSTDTAATIPTPTQLHIGQSFGNAQFANGYISRITYWSRRLANADLPILSRST